MRSWIFTGVALLVAGVAPIDSFAHHSFAMFDKTHPMTLVGVVKEFQWTNPHSYIALLVPNESGELKQWLIETGAPGSLTRLDSRWNADVIKPGDKLTVVIDPLKSGEAGGALVDLTTPGGLTLGQHSPH